MVGYDDRSSMLDSSLFAVDVNGDIIAHTVFDEWGKPSQDPQRGTNYAGLDNVNNFTGYTYDDVLDIYYAQTRFYNPDTKVFIQEDPIKDGRRSRGDSRNRQYRAERDTTVVFVG